MSKTLSIYAVYWRQPNAGNYVPPDPCAGGDYYEDLYGKELVTAYTAKAAREAVYASRSSAVIEHPKKLRDA